MRWPLRVWSCPCANVSRYPCLDAVTNSPLLTQRSKQPNTQPNLQQRPISTVSQQTSRNTCVGDGNQCIKPVRKNNSRRPYLEHPIQRSVRVGRVLSKDRPRFSAKTPSRADTIWLSTDFSKSCSYRNKTQILFSHSKLQLRCKMVRTPIAPIYSRAPKGLYLYAIGNFDRKLKFPVPTS